MAYGLTLEGWVPKPLAVILQDIQDAQKGKFGAALKNEDSAHALTQLNGIVAAPIAEVWEAVQALDSASDVRKAEGAALDALRFFTGSIRKTAAKSFVEVTLFAESAIAVPADGHALSVTGTGDRFVKADSVVAAFALVPDRAANTVYSPGDVIINNFSNVYVCSAGGTSLNGAFDAGANDHTDGNVEFKYVLTDPNTDGDVWFTRANYEAEESGAIAANAFTLTTIETALAGLLAVTNHAEASLGYAKEGDPEFRIRSANEVVTGVNMLEAIRADVARVPGVFSVTVYENDTDATVDGQPRKSIEVLVRGGNDDLIREAIAANKATGIQAFGTTIGAVVDSQGLGHIIAFTRPTEIPVWVDLQVTKLAGSQYGGDAALKQAIVTAGNGGTLTINGAELTFKRDSGVDAHASQFYGPAFSVAGVLRVTSLLVDDNVTPITAGVTIARRELAVFDVARVTVTSVDGVA